MIAGGTMIAGGAMTARLGVPAAVLALALTLAPTAPAHAHGCDRTDNDRAEANRVLTGITGEIDAMERAVVEALRLQTGQLSGYQAQSAKALTQALDAQTRLQAQTAREVEETAVMRAHRPSESACAAVTGITGLRGSRTATAGAYAGASEVEIGRIAGDRTVAAGAGSAADGAARFETVARVYCSSARAGDAACRGENAAHAADLKPGNLFDRRTLGTEAELRTAVELSRNLAAPVVHDPPPMASAETGPERRNVLLARSADARAALAADYFAYARSLRAPGADLGAWAAAIAPEAGRDPNKPVSRYELLELLAGRRFEDPDRLVALQEMSAENLLRELVMLRSIALTLDWERFRLDERRGAIDAARLALAAEEMRRLPGLAHPGIGAN